MFGNFFFTPIPLPTVYFFFMFLSFSSKLISARRNHSYIQLLFSRCETWLSEPKVENSSFESKIHFQFFWLYFIMLKPKENTSW